MVVRMSLVALSELSERPVGLASLVEPVPEPQIVEPVPVESLPVGTDLRRAILVARRQTTGPLQTVEQTDLMEGYQSE